MQQSVRAHIHMLVTPHSQIPHPLPTSPLQDDCRLLALPPGLLEDIVRRSCVLHDAACPAHVVGSCMALMRALLGCEGVRIKLYVTTANVDRCGCQAACVPACMRVAPACPPPLACESSRT